jgi:hypothetical protein
LVRNADDGRCAEFHSILADGNEADVALSSTTMFGRKLTATGWIADRRYDVR